MNFEVNIPEIGAEMLLTYLYPELEENWRVRNEGTFYRNYNNDSLHISPEGKEVSLARDGFLKLLPQGLVSPEDELKKGDKKEIHKEIERRKKILGESFIPIDTITFRRKLKIEREISQVLSEKLDYILKTYFNIDLEKEDNDIIRELALLLPYIRNRRGNFGLVKNILKSLLNCQINLLTGRFGESDSTENWIPLVRYELIIENLGNKEFNMLSFGLTQIREFISEWFIPAEMKCEILIKDHRYPNRLGTALTLDYNTQIQ